MDNECIETVSYKHLEAQKQMASIADSITAGAVGARAQGVNLSAEAQSA